MTFVDKEKTPKSYTEENNVDNSDEEQLVEELPDVLSKQRILLLNLAWFGLSLMFLLLSVEEEASSQKKATVSLIIKALTALVGRFTLSVGWENGRKRRLVPAQIQSLVGSAAKGRWLGGMVAAGAALTFFSSPLIGMQSDRSTFSVGRRRPVMILGAIALCTGLIGMAMSSPKVSMSRLARVTVNENETREVDCNKDLELLRCMPYRNASVYNPIAKHKDGAQDTGSIFNPQKTSKDGSLISDGDETEGNIGLYIIFYLIVTTSFAGITVPYNALIADKSHPSQRGLNSGVMAAMILTGNVSGAAVGTLFTQIGVIGSYSISIAVVILTLVATVFTTTEHPGSGAYEPIGCVTLFCGFWDPLKEHDFRWVFITRFLMQQGVSTMTGFLEYWLHDMIYLPNCWTAATCVAIMLLPMLFAAAVSSIIFGIVSDRIGRRKPFVICAAIGMCISIGALISISGKHGFYIAIAMAFFFGIFFGSFQSVDFALVMDVLPQEKDKAKDIAVWHQALILPNALATPMGGIILDYFQSVDCELGLGYIILFAVTAIYFCISGIFVLKIRRAR